MVDTQQSLTDSFESEATPAPSSDFKPRRVGRYTLLHEIAFGGMATVHLGRFSGAAGFEKMSRTIREKVPPRPSTRLSTLMAGEQATAARYPPPEFPPP